MFAYCNNNPVNCSDSLGLRPVSILERFGDTSISISPTKKEKEITNKESIPESKNIMEEWEEFGVTYRSYGPGQGGRINNSYLITEYDDIYEYAYYLVKESAFSADYLGSVTGVVYEWELHNDLYYKGPKFLKDNAQTVDLGATIYDDSHHGLEYLMWIGYFNYDPMDPIFDLIIHMLNK